MHYNYSLFTFATLAATALALPTAKPAETGSRVPASYEGKADGFDYGQWAPSDNEKKKDDGSWYPGKYEGKGTGHDDGKWAPTKYPSDKSKTKRDRVSTNGDSRELTEYESKGTSFGDARFMSEKYDKRNDDGTWRPGKYEGDCTGYDDGKWNPEKHN